MKMNRTGRAAFLFAASVMVVSLVGCIEKDYDLDDVDITITGSAARGSKVKVDAGGIYASVPSGLIIIVK